MSDQKKFGSVGWSAGDLRTLAPRLSEAEAVEWLEANEKYIRDGVTASGWGVLESLLIYDGVDRSPLYEFKEHEVVELIEECMGEPAGTRGTIVHIYEGGSLKVGDADHDLGVEGGYEMEVGGKHRTITVLANQIKTAE